LRPVKVHLLCHTKKIIIFNYLQRIHGFPGSTG
jgi:hypothetical protein